MPSLKQKVNINKPVHPKAPFSFRKNLLPPLLGLTVFGLVMALFNAQWIVAQYQYRYMKPVAQTNLTINTNSPSPDTKTITIPSINLSAPVVYNERSYNETKVQQALQRGVVHYGTTALPGQASNSVFIGHSSGQLWTPGDYKFVFTHLEKLKFGDRIFIDYEGTRYIYRVSDIVTVAPTNVSVLQPSTRPEITLITCTPVGTNKNRLIIRADQISPRPETATAVDPEAVKPVTAVSIPN